MTIRYNIVSNRFYLRISISSMRWNFANDLETALGELMRVDEIWINELVTYQKLTEPWNVSCVLRESRVRSSLCFFMISLPFVRQ